MRHRFALRSRRRQGVSPPTLRAASCFRDDGAWGVEVQVTRWHRWGSDIARVRNSDQHHGEDRDRGIQVHEPTS
jgi:hypothetical protein